MNNEQTTLSWIEFQNNIIDLKEKSDKLHDSWELITHDEEEGHKYLVKIVKQNVLLPTTDNLETDSENNYELMQFEYHLLFHISYRVPYLCFNVNKSDGSLLKLAEAWKLFNKHFLGNQIDVNMATILTEMHHPILFRPFLTLHPCRTAELLSAVPNSENKVLSFLSAIGPSIHLKMDLGYGNN